MTTDPGTRNQAASTLHGLFSHLGSGGNQPAPTPLSGLALQAEQFFTMPIELANIFMNMSVQLTELVLTSLEEAGITLVTGLMP